MWATQLLARLHGRHVIGVEAHVVSLTASVQKQVLASEAPKWRLSFCISSGKICVWEHERPLNISFSLPGGFGRWLGGVPGAGFPVTLKNQRLESPKPTP